MNRILKVAALTVLAIVLALPGAMAANQTGLNGKKTPTNNGALIEITTASLASAGADTAFVLPIDLSDIEPIIDCDTGVRAYSIAMYATGPASVDSLRVGIGWSSSLLGPVIQDRAIGTAAANTNGRINVKLDNTKLSNLIVPTTYISNVFARYMWVWFVNADASTAGAIKLRINVKGST